MTQKSLRRIAVKIGSNVLTRKDGTLDITRMSSIVDPSVKPTRNAKRNWNVATS